MVWDRGTYESQERMPPAQQLTRGTINVVLKGQKLRGGFALIRTGKRATDPGQKERWLLIKRRDEHADPSWTLKAPSLITRSSPAARSRRSKSGVREKCPVLDFVSRTGGIDE